MFVWLCAYASFVLCLTAAPSLPPGPPAPAPRPPRHSDAAALTHPLFHGRTVAPWHRGAGGGVGDVPSASHATLVEADVRKRGQGGFGEGRLNVRGAPLGEEVQRERGSRTGPPSRRRPSMRGAPSRPVGAVAVPAAATAGIGPHGQQRDGSELRQVLPLVRHPQARAPARRCHLPVRLATADRPPAGPAWVTTAHSPMASHTLPPGRSAARRSRRPAAPPADPRRTPTFPPSCPPARSTVGGWPWRPRSTAQRAPLFSPLAAPYSPVSPAYPWHARPAPPIRPRLPACRLGAGVVIRIGDGNWEL